MPKNRRGLKRGRGVSQAEEARRLGQRSSQIEMRQVSEPKPVGEISTENPTPKGSLFSDAVYMKSDAYKGLVDVLFGEAGPVYAENFLLGLKPRVTKGKDVDNKITMRWIADVLNVYMPQWGELPLDDQMKTAWEGWT